tara:strand:- start:7532 stop:7738 length:207 start_codon:yes stop_codon:yes gene_type:complete
MSLDVNVFLDDDQFKEKIISGKIFLGADDKLYEKLEASTSKNIFNITIQNSFDRYNRMKREIEIDKIL